MEANKIKLLPWMLLYVLRVVFMEMGTVSGSSRKYGIGFSFQRSMNEEAITFFKVFPIGLKITEGYSSGSADSSRVEYLTLPPFPFEG